MTCLNLRNYFSLIRGLMSERWIFLCLEIVNEDFFSLLSEVGFVTSTLIVAIGLVSSPGSVKTLSLEDSWLGGVGISATTRPLFANRQESVTSNGGSWVIGVVGVCAGVVGVVILGRVDSVTHGFAVVVVSLRYSDSILFCVS